MDKQELINKLSKGARKRHLIIGSLIFIIVTFFVFFTEYGLLTRVELKLKKAELSNDIKLERENYDSLKKLKKRLLSDTLEIEKVAREKYGFAREGEVIYFVDTLNGK